MADFFQDLAVRHLGKSASAIFLRCSHAEHADSAKAINHTARYVRIPIDFRSIEMLVKKLPKLGESSVQFGLLRCRDTRIWHHPISNEMSLEKTLGKTEGLWSCKKQFFSLLDFFLSLGVELIHSGFLWKNGRRIVAMRARLSNHAPHVARHPRKSVGFR